MDGTDYMVREGDTVHINKEVSDLVNSGALKPGEVFGYDRELYMVKGDKIIKIEPGIFRNGDYEPLWKELYGKAIDVLAGNSTFAEDKGGVETPETGTTPDESTPDEKDPSLKRGHATMSYSRYDSGWTVNVDGFDYSVIRGEVIEDTALNREILDAAKSVDSGEVFVYDDILYYKDEENGRIYEVTPRRQSDYNKVKNAITANAETWDKYTGSANKTGGTYVRGDLAKGKTVNVEKDGKTYKFEIDAVMGADTEAAKAANAAGLGDGEVFRHREDMYVYKNGKAYKLSAVAGFQNWHYDAYVEAATGQKTWPEGDFNYSDFLKEENQGSGNASTENSGGAQNGTQNGTQGGSGGGNVGGAENTATGDPVKREETDTDDSYKAKVQAWITEEFFDKNENGELNLKEGYEKKILDRGDLVTSGYSDNFINALDKTDDGKYVWYDFKAAQTITSDYLESINAKITDGGQWEIKEGKFTVNGKEYRVDKATVPELEGKASNSAGNCFVEYNSETYYLQKNEGRITPLKINKNSVSDAIGSVEKQGYWDKNNIDVEVGGKTYHVYIGTKLKESNDNDAEVISAANSAGIQSGEVFAYGDAMYIKNGSDYHKIGQQDWLYYDHDEQLLEALKTGEKTKRPEIGEVVQNKNGKAYFAGEVKGGTSQKVQIEGRTYDITLETIKYGKDTDIYSASKNIDTNSFFVYDDKLYVKGEDGVYGVGGNDWDKLKSFVVDGRGEARAITGYPGAITTNRTVLGQAPNKFTVRYGAKVAEFQTMGNELKFNANNDPGIKYASRNVGNNEVFVYGDEVYYKDEQGKIFATNADDKTTNTIKDILMNSRAPKFEYADMQGVKIDATEQVRKNTFETMGSDFNFNSSMVPVDIDIKDGMSVYLDSKDPRNTTIGKVIKVFTDESSLTSDARRAGVEDGAIFVIDGVLYVYVEQEINKVNKSFVFQIDPTENAKNIIESYKNSASPMSYTGQLSEVAPAAKSGGEREYGYSDYLI